jgi:hypothetical protein
MSTPRYGSAPSNCPQLNYCDIPDVTERMLIQLWNFLPYGQAMVIKRTTVQRVIFSSALLKAKLGLRI